MSKAQCPCAVGGARTGPRGSSTTTPLAAVTVGRGEGRSPISFLGVAVKSGENSQKGIQKLSEKATITPVREHPDLVQGVPALGAGTLPSLLTVLRSQV